jgi:four helix bundle protein
MSAHPSKSDQLEKRFVAFASAIIKLSGQLPRTEPGRHICKQILRSGTATAAVYGEARGAESRADFIHKLRIVFKELNETTIWLELIASSGLLPLLTISPIVAENRELCRVIAASIRTAKASLSS